MSWAGLVVDFLGTAAVVIVAACAVVEWCRRRVFDQERQQEKLKQWSGRWKQESGEKEKNRIRVQLEMLPELDEQVELHRLFPGCGQIKWVKVGSVGSKFSGYSAGLFRPEIEDSIAGSSKDQSQPMGSYILKKGDRIVRVDVKHDGQSHPEPKSLVRSRLGQYRPLVDCVTIPKNYGNPYSKKTE